MLSVRIRKEFAAKEFAAPANGSTNAASATGDEGRSGGFMLDVGFVAPPGITILFGASGSGKTLTLKSIAGLVEPDAGVISIGDAVLFDASRRINRPVRERGVGYVFQNLALFPHLSARANVEFPLSNLSRAERRARAQALLESFGIGHVAERLPRNISGGEAQRVALARALAYEPRMLLLDEPLSALDDATKLEIVADLKKLNRDLRLPVIYVTHSRDEALMLGERAFLYERGRIVASGEPVELFAGAPLKASVARLTGVENIFKGRILSRHERAGTMVVQIGEDERNNCRVETPLGGQSVAEQLTIAVRSRDIMLATEEPRGISARNVLRGRIVAIEDRSEHTLVHVESGAVWAASVTKESARQLRLTIEKDVWLAFKTYACRVLDHD